MGVAKSNVAWELKILESSLKTILVNEGVRLQNASKFSFMWKVAKEGLHKKLERVLVKWLH